MSTIVDNKAFGRQLRGWRKLTKLTQAELSCELTLTLGQISKEKISEWENCYEDGKYLHEDNLKKLIEFFVKRPEIKLNFQKSQKLREFVEKLWENARVYPGIRDIIFPDTWFSSLLEEVFGKDEVEQGTVSDVEKEDLIGFKELLAQSDFLERPELKAYSPEFIVKFIFDHEQKGVLRERAYQLYLFYNLPIVEKFKALLEDVDEEVRVGALKSVITHGLEITPPTLKHLLINPPYEVARQAVKTAKFLVQNFSWSPEILVVANDYKSIELEGWKIRGPAVRAIVDLKLPNSVELITRFTKISYHVTITFIITHFDELKKQGNLSDSERKKVIEYLRHLRKNKMTTQLSRKKIDKAIERFVKIDDLFPTDRT